MKNRDELPPHMQRVLDEYNELDEHIEKLHVFIQDNKIFKTLYIGEQLELIEQRAYMRNYRTRLVCRLARY